MLLIKTSVMGRQKLLNNSYVRNYLYGKYLTIEVSMEDKLDKDGNVDQSVPLFMTISTDGDRKFVIDNNTLNYPGCPILDAIKLIKNAVEYLNKGNKEFQL